MTFHREQALRGRVFQSPLAGDSMECSGWIAAVSEAMKMSDMGGAALPSYTNKKISDINSPRFLPWELLGYMSTEHLRVRAVGLWGKSLD
jgi:hypothetical protein